MALHLRDHLKFLDRFVDQVKSGVQKLDGTLRRRSELYVESARSTYQGVRQTVMQARGYDMEENVLADSEHCPGCLDATAQGVVPIGTLPAIGDRDCMARCRCQIRYSKSGDA